MHHGAAAREIHHVAQLKLCLPSYLHTNPKEHCLRPRSSILSLPLCPSISALSSQSRVPRNQGATCYFAGVEAASLVSGLMSTGCKSPGIVLTYMIHGQETSTISTMDQGTAHAAHNANPCTVLQCMNLHCVLQSVEICRAMHRDVWDLQHRDTESSSVFVNTATDRPLL